MISNLGGQDAGVADGAEVDFELLAIVLTEELKVNLIGDHQKADDPRQGGGMGGQKKKRRRRRKR